MIDCIPNADGTCINCGWKKPERCKTWPRRNCPKSPDLEPAASRLGYPLEKLPHQELAKWMAAHYPERTPEQIAATKAACETCGHWAELDDRCQCGKCSKKGVALEPLRKIATWTCPEKRWPNENGKENPKY